MMLNPLLPLRLFMGCLVVCMLLLFTLSSVGNSPVQSSQLDPATLTAMADPDFWNNSLTDVASTAQYWEDEVTNAPGFDCALAAPTLGPAGTPLPTLPANISDIHPVWWANCGHIYPTATRPYSEWMPDDLPVADCLSDLVSGWDEPAPTIQPVSTSTPVPAPTEDPINYDLFDIGMAWTWEDFWNDGDPVTQIQYLAEYREDHYANIYVDLISGTPLNGYVRATGVSPAFAIIEFRVSISPVTLPFGGSQMQLKSAFGRHRHIALAWADNWNVDFFDGVSLSSNGRLRDHTIQGSSVNNESPANTEFDWSMAYDEDGQCVASSSPASVGCSGSIPWAEGLYAPVLQYGIASNRKPNNSGSQELRWYDGAVHFDARLPVEDYPLGTPTATPSPTMAVGTPLPTAAPTLDVTDCDNPVLISDTPPVIDMDIDSVEVVMTQCFTLIPSLIDLGISFEGFQLCARLVQLPVITIFDFSIPTEWVFLPLVAFVMIRILQL